jgi:putative toxin-antitoxin system antitoxin component (TIGR02293 family)
LAEEERPFQYEEIVSGIEARRVKHLIDRDVLPAKVVFQVIPERTFGRRLANRAVLKVPEADAIARLLRVTETANRVFGKRDFARGWLRLPNPTLKYQIPIEMAQTDAGAREVEAAISRLVHGDYV